MMRMVRHLAGEAAPSSLPPATRPGTEEPGASPGAPSAPLSPLGVSLVSPARESTVAVPVVRGLVEAVEQAGVIRADFLRAGRLEPEQLDALEARLPRSQVSQLCELAMDLTGDSALGLHWAERLTERMFVPISHLLAHCSSLRQAFELLAQFFQLLADEAAYRIVERGDQVVLQRLPLECESARMRMFESEMMMGGFWRLVRSFNRHASPELVSFDYPAPAHHADYARIFENRQLFDQPFTGLAFDRALLNAPSPQKDDDVREALQALAERRLSRITQRTAYAVRVREYLVREGFPHRTDMESVARALDLSVRSLRRRLADEGKSFGDISNEALAMIAKNLLGDPRRTIQEVAYEMGFSDPSTFHRAFKRWTGITPSAYRDKTLV